MKINPNSIKTLEAYKTQVKEREKNAAKTRAAGQNDRLDISRKAQELQQYRQELDRMSGVREELVASLKARVQEGTYQPSPAKIAEGIIQEKLLDEKV